MSLLPQNSLSKRLSSPALFYYALMWLIVLLFWGTVAQKSMGLYSAQEKFFSSWILWLGPLPTPGGRLTLAIITLGLIAKLIFSSTWSLKKSGIIITHLGALLLLGGGVLTAYFSTEGSLVIVEGEKSAIYQDYHLHELVVLDMRDSEQDKVLSFSGRYLKKGSMLENKTLPFKIEVLNFFKNVSVLPKSGLALPEEQSVAKRFVLKEKALESQDARNRAGARIKISGIGNQDGIYILYDSMEVTQSLHLDGGEIQLGIRKKTYRLPFEIELLDFERQIHPGTNRPRSFKSVVNVIRSGAKREVTISMNKPLRIDGYTLFQSSFSQQGRKETSIFAVVENKGRLFPYISSIIICIGILIHLVLHIPQLIRRA